MKVERAFLPATEFAAATLGAQVAAARRELGWTQAELAGRLGVSRQLLAKVEAGSVVTSLGTVLEAAIICGVPLFGVEPSELAETAERERLKAALLPTRVRARKTPVIPNDF